MSVRYKYLILHALYNMYIIYNKMNIIILYNTYGDNIFTSRIGTNLLDVEECKKLEGARKLKSNLNI